jgi:two-component system chemotaxis response regulator CheB
MAAGAKVRVNTGSMGIMPAVDKKLSADAVLRKQAVDKHFKTTEQLIAIGASTGGTEAIKEVLVGMSADAPAVVITQHIPKAFSTSFARRMDSLSPMTVFEAEDGQHIIPGHVYIAPGDQHLLVVRDGARYRCQLSDGPPVNRHRPSVDVLFRSVAQQVGRNAIGVLLTGMGDDGAQGLKEMRDAGAYTIAQDEKTSVVWGMPGEAVKRGGVDSILPLQAIPEKLASLAACRI